MAKLIVEQSAVRELYSEQGKTGKKLMQQIFGEEALKERRIGVWCLATDGVQVKAEEWSNGYDAQGCLVVTEEDAFIVGLHASVALQWGAMDKAKSKLIQDKETSDCKSATDAMLKAYEGASYKDKDDEIWNVDEAPAAQWCRQYSHGNIGFGDWNLPTVSQLQAMSQYRNEINTCIKVMGGYKLTPGWYWSSIEHSDKAAWVVAIGNGYVAWNAKYGYGYVRAVSAFQL